MSLFLAFLALSIVVIVTPGPDTAMTIRNTLFGGRAGGIFTALGIASGQTIWALATSIGIVALLIASEPLFLAVKYAGAAYLVFLGVQALRAAIRPMAATHGGPFAPPAHPPRNGDSMFPGPPSGGQSAYSSRSTSRCISLNDIRARPRKCGTRRTSILCESFRK